ncbi:MULTISPECIES: helix-turn-helix domain-containing protein [Paenibacillus]|uniref:Helix-turn-helix domain-containing protein n=1 Tax=Paenibacillus artemisiicola TaxID=1172618 RepID=A0ABS3W786_9BACL|nr:helix-turn-helix domain-containing protein [Paenibacillus artemisiicola]MBO7744171.1 helix-turn-helix domain-containing protein [Paenibacillus artemisiicola]
MTVREAAETLKVHPRTIYNMIDDGRLKATKNYHGAWEISDEQIDQMLNESIKRGDRAMELGGAIDVLQPLNQNSYKNTFLELIEVAEKAVTAFKSGNARPETIISDFKKVITRLDETDSVSSFIRKVMSLAGTYNDESFESLELLVNVLESRNNKAV